MKNIDKLKNNELVWYDELGCFRYKELNQEEYEIDVWYNRNEIKINFISLIQFLRRYKMFLTDIDIENINDEIIKQVLFSTSTIEYGDADCLIVFGCHIKSLLDERM